MTKAKTAVVTGSTSGIGLGIAKALAAEGVSIMMNGIEDEKDVAEIREDIENQFGVETDYMNVNLMEGKGCRDLIKGAQKKFDQIDILVNNAGIQFVAPIEEFPDDKWEGIIALNLSAAFHTSKAVFPGMKKRGWGRIVNICSAHGLVASPFKSAYVSAKHGILGLTKTIALEGAEDGITVNAICPGYVWTPLVEAQIPDTAKSRNMTEEEVKQNVLLEAQPTKEFVTIHEVAQLAVYLCSDAAKSITGSAQVMDGGWTAQ